MEIHGGCKVEGGTNVIVGLKLWKDKKSDSNGDSHTIHFTGEPVFITGQDIIDV